MNKYNLKIKCKDSSFICKRSDVISFFETSDGVVLQLKNGLLLQYVNNFMDSGTKSKIKLSIDNLNGNIDIDLDDLKNPIKINVPD